MKYIVILLIIVAIFPKSKLNNKPKEPEKKDIFTEIIENNKMSMIPLLIFIFYCLFHYTPEKSKNVTINNIVNNFTQSSTTIINNSTKIKDGYSNQEFIDYIAPIAKNQKQYKLFPSLIIAQACHESGWGRSGLSNKYNNLFGVKASSGWDGKVIALPTNEEVYGQVITITANFRQYNNWSESIEDHSKFLLVNSNYTKSGVFSSDTPESQLHEIY
jgi:flagellum-specific peptidoglycan hydrolase FlgJ